MAINIYSINGIGSFCTFDSEYIRIVRELKSLGIEPTGDKNIDKAKLYNAKEAIYSSEISNIQIVSKTAESEKLHAQSAQESLKNDAAFQTQNMTGAEQIAAVNKYKILGLL